MQLTRILVLVVLLWLTAPVARASCFASVSWGGEGTTSSAINTTGATLLVAIIGSYSYYTGVMSDNQGNINWETSSEYDAANTQFGMIVYKNNPVTSSSHTFTVPGTGAPFVAATVWACNGTTADHPFTQQNGLNTSSTSLNWQPGPVTPVETGDLIFSAGVFNGALTSTSINSGFATPVTFNGNPSYLSLTSSWLVAPSTAAVNPTWTTSVANWTGLIAVFKSSTAAASVITVPFITTLAGSGIPGFGGNGGPATSAKFNYPGQIVRTSLGLICLTDVNNNQVRCVNQTAGSITQYGVTIAPGNIDAVAGNVTLGYVVNVPPLSARMAHPVGLAIDASDCMYVADQQNSVIEKFCPGGNFVVVAGGGSGGVNGPGCSTAGQSAPNAGFAGDGAAATSALLSCPQGVALDAASNIYISDSNNYRVRVVNIQATTRTIMGISVCAGCIQTIFGSGTNSCSISTALGSWLAVPLGLRVSAAGDLYVAINGCNQIYKLTAAGTPSVFIGDGTQGYLDSSNPLTAKLRLPFDVEIAPGGDLYFADTVNGAIRKWAAASNAVSTVAGNVALYPYIAGNTWNGGGYSGDGSSAKLAGLFYPIGVKIDSSNNIYIGDLANSRLRRLYSPMLGMSGITFTSGITIK